MDQVYNVSELEKALKAAANKLVVVYFTSMRCGPCKLMAPHVESLNESMDDVVFIKIDTENSEDFVELFKITGVPAFHFYKFCKPLQTHNFQGANEAYLKRKLDELRRL